MNTYPCCKPAFAMIYSVIIITPAQLKLDCTFTYITFKKYRE